MIALLNYARRLCRGRAPHITRPATTNPTTIPPVPDTLLYTLVHPSSSSVMRFASSETDLVGSSDEEAMPVGKDEIEQDIVKTRLESIEIEQDMVETQLESMEIEQDINLMERIIMKQIITLSVSTIQTLSSCMTSNFLMRENLNFTDVLLIFCDKVSAKVIT